VHRKLTLLTLPLVLFTAVAACAPPSHTRYVDKVFGLATETKALRYATAPDLVSGAPVDLALDVFQPAGDQAVERPAIIWVHSGGFSGGSRDQMTYFASEYAQRGYVTFSIDYRLDPGNRCQDVQDGKITNPTQLANEKARCQADLLAAQHDAQAAVRWVRARATTYRVDPNKLAIGGFSAGAITALHVAYRSDDPGDVGDLDGTDSRVQAALAASGCNYFPESIGPGDAPVHLAHARFDPLVPFSCVQDTAARARKAGLVAQTLFYDVDATHAELLYFVHKSAVDAAWTSFLVAQLHLR
jgi:para-nitrobenzyl esterase